jgi:HSP20 family molecular chaperone IbpA
LTCVGLTSFNPSRQVTLPEEVEPSKIKASVDDGVLTITIPKKEKEDKKKVKVVDK